MKTIKITHTGSIPGAINLLVKNAGTTDVLINLSPGNYTYAENDMETNSIIVYRRKGIITVKEEDKPFHLGFYTVYGPNTETVYNASKETISTVDATFFITDTPEINAVEYTLPIKKEKKGKKRGRHKKRGPKKGSKNKRSKEQINPN